MAKKTKKAVKSKGKAKSKAAPKRVRKPREIVVQPKLFETEPENAKELAKLAREYKAAVKERMECGAEEKSLKEKLREAVKSSGIVADKNGSYSFHADGLTITVTPRDELIRVKEDGEESEDADAE